MQIRHRDLEGVLAEPLKPIWLVSSDETLLVEESCDAVIAAARQQGFTERSIHYVESGFKWDHLHHDAASLSLFAERKILDVRVPAKKFDREASAALREWAEAPPADNVLLLRTGRLDGRQKSNAWFKAIDQTGVVLIMWPVDRRDLPKWLKERCRLAGLELDREALDYLCERVEGNLLAANQEVQKLALLGLPNPITLEHLLEQTLDVTRYSSFDLLDAMMAGETARVAHILKVLREEGVAVMAILGALGNQLRRLGGPQRLPPQRQRLIAALRKRIPHVHPVLAECAIVDQQVKGQLPGDPWISLEQILLRLAGAKGLSVPSRDLKVAREA